MDVVEEMQQYYEKRAPLYDSSMGYDDRETVHSLQPVIGGIRSLLRDRRVLEIACGPCFWTEHVSDVAVSVLATDYNQSTLDQARKKPLPWEKVSLLRADAYDLSGVQGPFDALLAVDWLAHVPRSRFRDFLEGLHDRLHPGSVVVFCDQLPGPESWSGLYDGEGNHLQTRELNDGTTWRVIKHFLSEQELKELFVGYSDQVQVTRYPGCGRVLVSYATRGDDR